MIRLLFKPFLLLLMVMPSACITTKLDSYPKTIGYSRGETIAFSQSFKNVSRYATEDLMDWTNQTFEKKLSSLSRIDFWDADYKTRQYGILLSQIDVNDRKQLKVVYEKVGIKYMLVNQVMLHENSLAEEGSPDYKTPKVSLYLQLIDFEHGLVIWRCTTKVSIGPLEIQKEDGSSSVHQVLGSYRAFYKAYHKSIKKLIKGFGKPIERDESQIE